MLILLLACGEKETDSGTELNLVDEMVEQLSGSFDSSLQASQNPEYFSVSLKTCSVLVPELGNSVLYVEQSLVDKLNQPYRQRLYVITEGIGSDVASHIYELVNPDRFIGLCDSNDNIEIALDELSEKEGCTVNLNWNGVGFVGQTDTGTCLSTMNGATYATSEVTTDGFSITSWDRGWDNNDNQVWGAENGAYIFVRK